MSGHTPWHKLRSRKGLTSDPADPRLTHGPDTEPGPQAEVYLVLSDEELAKGFVRPLRHAYWHENCGSITTMSAPLAETYARDPSFYGATYCVRCGQHRPVGDEGEFRWVGRPQLDQPRVGT